MRKLLLWVAFLVLTAVTASAAAKPLKADKVLAEAKTKASEQHKAIFLIFGASWCDACHVLDSFLDRPEIRIIFDKYFVVTRLTVFEQIAGKPDLDNPGADQFMLKLGGIASNGEVGLPFFVVMDQKGSALITSVRPVKGKPTGIGFPQQPDEIAWFLDMLKHGAPSL